MRIDVRRVVAGRNVLGPNASGSIAPWRAVLAALIAAAAAAQGIGVAHAQSPIVIKFSHVVAQDTPKGKAAQRFKELAEAGTKGRVKVEIYPNSQLYKDGDELEALQRGAVQMLAPSVSKFGPLGVRDFEVFDLPYMFANRAAVERVTDGEIGRQLLAKLEPKGIKGVAYWDSGFKHMSANRPLRKVDDFRGLKVRIQSSKVLAATFKQLGAIPQVLAFSEVYTALQQGVVDGLENTLSNMYTQKMYEVQKHLTLSNHGFLLYAVIVNKKFWDGLPTDVRAALEQSMKEATRYEREIADKEDRDALAAIKASSRTQVYALTDSERAAWKQALLPVVRQFENAIGKDTIAAIDKISAQAEAEAKKK
ncbi:MAG TPA: TRAP transporter substrate-binding protein [Burkholderiales bacterium]|nr:TRAP transporter substrate-binding protein [Burkholderiales bacterium]